MRRRSPPTSLRLVQGPVPPRSVPRHTLPSVPRPTFAQPATVVRGPTPRQQALHNEDPVLAAKFDSLPAILIPPTPTSRGSLRGPWDHSGPITAPIDMERLLSPLKPVALVQ
ncbi:hypothetical protein B0H16DRAFT_1514779 [Mycena metata]|uniref:Uncharacterized protein n=1 Tax=Mycena metata TaxID=1033252 RepID=A0AAD7NR77_9AGAR|nr:hypothetical protein B0H16DRAFT_1514779 [Mycena metata]